MAKPKLKKPAPVADATPLPKAAKARQRRGLRMRIGADGGMDIHHLMSDGGMFAPGLVELADSDGPVWIQVAKAGQFHKGGKFTLNSTIFADICKNFADTANRRIPIDFEHASEADPTSGDIPVRGAPAQGWITQLDNRGETLWALVEWLPQAREYIRAGQYKFFSPAIRFNALDRNTGAPIGARMTSGALTNNPFLDGMAPLAARDFGEQPVTEEEAKLGAVELSWDIESPNAPRLNLDVNVLQAMEGIRDLISAILPPCDDEDEDEEPGEIVPQFAPMSDRQPTAPVAAMAPKEPIMSDETISLKDHTSKVAELQLTLKDAESKLALAESRVAELEAAEAVRLTEAKTKRIDAAFAQYKDSKKLSDLDKEAMVCLFDSKPEVFEKLYPVVDVRAVLLTSRVSTERTPKELPPGVAKPSMQALADKHIAAGKTYDEAWTLAISESAGTSAL